MKTLLLALLAIVLASTTASAAPARTWTAGDKINTFKVGALTLQFAQAHDEDGANIPVLQIRSAGAPALTIVGQSGTNPVTANWVVASLDRSNTLPQVMFSSFSGGAHCCSHIFIAEKLRGGWTAFDLGMFDGDGLVEVPRDVDGDGVLDIVRVDNRFLYTFTSYADSFAPPVVINIANGQVNDVSKAPRYKKFIAGWMADARAKCAQRNNGACAGYVADAARIGRFDEAWKFMLANYDPALRWDLPGRCAGTLVNGQCKGKSIKPRDFPQSLRWFLEDSGYIARAR